MDTNGQTPDEEFDDQPVADEAKADEATEAEQLAEEVVELSDLEQAESKAAENWERYLRTAAELENVRKRAARDVENAHRFALERFGRELLAVKDSLEMGLAAAENAIVESLLEGSGATLKSLAGTMQQFGIEELDPAFADMPILRQRRDNAKLGTVLSNSFGFGGTNATLVFKHIDA